MNFFSPQKSISAKLSHKWRIYLRHLAYKNVCFLNRHTGWITFDGSFCWLTESRAAEGKESAFFFLHLMITFITADRSGSDDVWKWSTNPRLAAVHFEVLHAVKKRILLHLSFSQSHLGPGQFNLQAFVLFHQQLKSNK